MFLLVCRAGNSTGVCVCGKASVFKACRSKLMAALQRFNILEVDGIKPGDAGN